MPSGPGTSGPGGPWVAGQELRERRPAYPNPSGAEPMMRKRTTVAPAEAGTEALAETRRSITTSCLAEKVSSSCRPEVPPASSEAICATKM